jgi:hypothetical protein
MEKYMYKCIPITGIKLKKKILINTMILSRAAALAPKMLAPEKSPGIKFCRQFQKVGARKFRFHNLFIQNRSLSSMQILSLMTPALKS